MKYLLFNFGCKGKGTAFICQYVMKVYRACKNNMQLLGKKSYKLFSFSWRTIVVRKDVEGCYQSCWLMFKQQSTIMMEQLMYTIIHHASLNCKHYNDLYLYPIKPLYASFRLERPLYLFINYNENNA